MPVSIDVEGGNSIDDAVILIEDKRIVAAGPATGITIREAAERIALPGKWLIPGLMNMHVHISLLLPGLMTARHGNESEAELVLRMAENAKKSLYSGVQWQPVALTDLVNPPHIPGRGTDTLADS